MTAHHLLPAVLGALLFATPSVAGQAQAPIQAQVPAEPQTQTSPDGLVTNPRAIEFDIPNQTVRITAYRLELFRRGADTQAAQPDWVVNIPRRDGPDEGPGTIRIDLTSALKGVPNGEYIATLRAVGANSLSPRSAPTAPFAVSGPGSRSSSDRGLPGTPAVTPPADPDPAQGGAPDRRLWTIIGLAMGAAAIIGPLLLR